MHKHTPKPNPTPEPIELTAITKALREAAIQLQKHNGQCVFREAEDDFYLAVAHQLSMAIDDDVTIPNRDLGHLIQTIAEILEADYIADMLKE